MDCLQLFIAGCQRITVIERTAVKIRHDDVLICFSEILITWQRIHQERKQITLPARVKSKCDTDRTEAVIRYLSFPRKIP